MNTTLTIRNLDVDVKQRLRIQAARHGRSMEAEAREILARGVMTEAESSSPDTVICNRFDHLVGLWKGRGSTDQVMRELRGED